MSDCEPLPDPFADDAPPPAAADVPEPDRYVDATFGEGGYLARAFPGYRPREGQIAMTKAVDRAIVTERHLLAEGPCGLGKSVALLVPVTYHAVREKKQVVVVTANLALQAQYMEKDLPMLANILPWRFTFESMKGRSNYLCVDRFDAMELESKAGGFDVDEEGRRQLPVVREWARRSIAHIDDRSVPARGDLSELPFEPSHALRRKFTVQADECKRNRCRYKGKCFPNRANERAKAADVVVTNYAMLLSHLSVFDEIGGDVVLPPFHYLIMDEAHKLPDIARGHFGFSVREDQIRRVARLVQRTDPVVADTCERATTQIFHVFAELRRDQTRYKARIDLGKMRPEEVGSWQRAIESIEPVLAILERRREEKSAALRALRGMDAPESEIEDAEDALGVAEQHADRARTVLTQLRTPHDDGVFDAGGEPDYVHFLEEDERRRVALSCLLLRPAELLSRLLFHKRAVALDKEAGPIDLGHVTVVGASATLATEGGSFSFAKSEMGAYDCDTFLGASPFDWPNQALFVLPDDMPDPNDKTFRDAVAEAVERVVLLAGGRTLALFTSRRSLEHTYEKLWPVCRRQGYTLLRQGDEPRPTLIRRFREDVTSVLLGTESFWAGVDVQGEACSAVVIDRLPFPTPDDPILDALTERDRSAFFKYAVPKAILAFRQATGRLIRTTTDRGVIVCLDRRIAEKRYGSLFLRALPNVPKTRNLAAIVDWLRPPADEDAHEMWDAV